MPNASTMVNVAILVVPDVTASAVYAMFDLFAGAGRDWSYIMGGVAGDPRMRPYIVSAAPGPVLSANGIAIATEYTLADCPAPDIVCIPDFAMPIDAECSGSFAAEIAWLRARHEGGATLASLCTSAMMLAATGLLDGLDATTHWAYAGTFSRLHPSVRLHPGRALVVTGLGQRIVMAGGGTSHLDLVLYLIGRFVGVKEALQVAKAYLIEWHDAGQLPFTSLQAKRQTTDRLIAKCQEWAAENYASAAPVSAMTKLSGLAERTFIRRFAAATGMSPLDYVHAIRLEEAKQMLETEERSIEAIAHEVGYEDSSFFGRLFRRKVGLTPAQYRRRFGSLRFAVPATGRTEAFGPPA